MKSIAALILISILNSIACYGQTEKIRTRTIDYTRYDQLVQNLGTATDKVKAADQLIEEVKKTFTPQDEEFFYAHLMAGNSYQYSAEPVKAMQMYQQAIDAYEKHYPFYNRGYSMISADFALYGYVYLSNIYRELKLFDKAVKFLESKRKILEENTSSSIRQQFYSEYAQALLGTEQYDESIKMALRFKELTESGAMTMNYQSADEIYKINPSDPPEVQEQMKKAKEQYEKIMRESQESVLSGQRLNYNTVLANAYFNQYQFAEALPYMEGWIKEMNKMMEKSAAAIKQSHAQMETYAMADSLKKKVSQSISFYSDISEIGGYALSLIIAAQKTNNMSIAQGYSRGLLDKAMLHQLTGEPEKAEQYYQSAFAIMRKMSSYDFAKQTGDQLYSGFLPAYINLLVQTQKLDKAYEESGRLITQAETLLKKNFQYFSEGERKEFFKAYNGNLEKYLSLLLLMTEKNNDRSGEILNKILQTKGIILDVTREQEKRLKKLNDKTVIAQIKTIRKLRERLAAFYQISQQAPTPAISDSVNRISVLVNDLERKVNEKLGPTDILKPVTWKSVQEKLKTDEIYIEILRLKRENFNFDKPAVQYWGFAIKKGIDQPILFKLSEGESFDGRGLKGYQNRIKSLLEDNDSYDLYWAKIGENIQGFNKVFLSGDGVYHIVNPLTLKNPASGKFLVNEVSIKRVSTGRDFLLHSDDKTTNTSIALIGNPAFDMSRKGALNQYKSRELEFFERISEFTRSGFASLPGTQQEVQSIQTMASSRGIKVEALSGTQANESRVKNLHSPHTLHVATHGEFDQLSKADSYLKSRLILAGAADKEPLSIEDYSRYEDGFLTAYEVIQLDLSQTNLVVLSACETGLGEVQSGEGVWGLQRAFQLAGARSVMGSLWKISDEATVLFMETFYKNYLSGIDIHHSYQRAMEATMQRHPHPYYWGAFVLTGIDQ